MVYVIKANRRTAYYLLRTLRSAKNYAQQIFLKSYGYKIFECDYQTQSDKLPVVSL